MRQEATVAEIAADTAQDGVDKLVDEMIILAERLRIRARAFTTSQRSATSIAAGIVNDFTQGTGVVGSRLWGVVYNAGIADQARMKEAKSGD
jgi:hypothetical protein